MDLAKEIYKITESFPKSEVYGLASQMQRSAVAIPSNISEGAKRNHLTEYIQFLSIANGSAAELETQLLLTKDLNFSDEMRIKNALLLVEEVLKMLHVLINRFKYETVA